MQPYQRLSQGAKALYAPRENVTIMLHAFCVVFQLINAIVCAVGAVENPVGLGMGYFAYKGNDIDVGGSSSFSQFSSVGFFPVGEVSVKWMDFAFFLWTPITENLVQIWLHHRSVNTEGKPTVLNNFSQYLIQRRHNPVRWLSYSIGSLLMTLINARLAGEVSILGWLTLAGCNFAMIGSGDTIERYGNQWGYYFYGWIFGGIIFAHDVVLIASAPGIPAWVYIIIFSNYAAYFVFAVIAGLECLRLFSDYRTTDRLYIAMSLLSKVSQGYQGFFALGGL